MKHEVDVNGLIDFQNEKLVLFARSSKENKTLYATLRGSYEVWHKGEKVLQTTTPVIAVKKYNSIDAKD